MTVDGFFAMGGYARYVWPCYALAISVLLWNLWSARRYHAQALKRAQRALAMAGSERS
ncbi:MAG: heme exporter protein CcmD [Steroidobacteraceae bacterium]|jgi:heme exporter protein CcmD